MKKTRHDRQAFIDHLERKYIRKIQRQALQKEQDDIKKSLFSFRGRHFEGFEQTPQESKLSPAVNYRLHYL
jgi:hypothetical protein